MKIKSITSAVLVCCLLAASVFSLSGCGKAEKSKTEEDSAYYSSSFSTIKWPNSTLAKMLPAPKSTTGLIDNDSSKWLKVYIGDTVHVYEEKLGINVDVRVIDRVYNVLTQRVESMKLSNKDISTKKKIDDVMIE